MKIFKPIFICSLLAMFAAGCEQELDPITEVKPGSDNDDPTVVITYPAPGKSIRLIEGNPNTFNLIVTTEDDIEIASVNFQIDGEDMGSVTEFKDYRRAVVNFPVNDLEDGDHSLLVTVTDKTGKTATATRNFKKTTAPPYTAMEGELLYLPFDGDFADAISGAEPVVNGSPTNVTGKVGDAYQGSSDSYLSFPADEIVKSDNFAVAFWYKLNPTPGRGGLISLSRPVSAPTAQDNRNSGFRMGREPGGDNQNIFANLGNNPADEAGEVWLNPFYSVAPGTDWIHIAVSIEDTVAITYVNAEEVFRASLETPIDWTGVTTLTIGSGMPNWIYWDHESDASLYDEMHFFNRPLTVEEIIELYEYQPE